MISALNYQRQTIKIIFLIFAFVHFSIGLLYGQINMSDSSSQIVGYWNIGDSQSYDLSLEKLSVVEGDTVSHITILYEVDITIKDSTENSYIIEWFYKNYRIDTDNELLNKLSSMTEDISVLIKTDELGSVEEVINWEEVRDYMLKGVEVVREEYKNTPNIDQVLNQTMGIFKTKELIQANAIKDAIQFYAFHGVKYELHEEINGELKFLNNFGGEPLDVDVSIVLDELNGEEDNSVIRMYQEVNSEQLTEATWTYLSKAGAFGKQDQKISDLPPITNEVWTASRIHGSTGWTTYSVETKEVRSEGALNLEERIIQIK